MSGPNKKRNVRLKRMIDKTIAAGLMDLEDEPLTEQQEDMQMFGFTLDPEVDDPCEEEMAAFNLTQRI